MITRIGAGTHFRERLTPRASVAEEIPAWPVIADLGGEPAFIIAIVPLLQIRGDNSNGPEARQLAGPPRPLGGLTRTSVNATLEPSSQRACVVLASLGQGDIGPSRVPAGQRLRRFAVTGQVTLGERFVHGVFLVVIGIVLLIHLASVGNVCRVCQFVHRARSMALDRGLRW